MPDYKRQHYVPRSYLERFSSDGNTLKVFSIKENKIVTETAPISRQCYENYFYSDDPQFEQALSPIEADAKRIIKKIDENNTLPSKREVDYFNLLVFVLFQSARTLFAAEELQKVFEKFLKTMIKDDITVRNLKEISHEDVDNTEIGIKNPSMMNLSIASLIIPLLFDLNAKILINKSKMELITSDNPVVIYNKYYLRSSFSYTGYACKGLIIYIPLSPFNGLIYYDPIIYKMGGNKLRTPVFISNADDITNLNILQVINSRETIYTINMDQAYLKTINAKAAEFREKGKFTLSESPLLKLEDGDVSKIIGMHRVGIKYDAKLSFLKINKKIPIWYLRQRFVRDMELIKLHREFEKKVLDKEIKASDWGKFIASKSAPIYK